ncbi:MAG TPA: GAF domain-containing protein [Candidatus Dormibacteraeota bacterium]|nr:GAF domain-containing protein [Candidatus Dormibacteraeota bacterium]
MAPPVSLNTVPVAMVVYDGHGTVVEANPAALSMLGLSAGDLIGAHADASDWLVIESAEGPITVHPVVASLKSGQAVRGVLVRARRPDGADVWLQVDALPDDDRVIAILTDVTHLIARSRASSRSSGDHIVDRVTDRLVSARMEPRAILATVTEELSRLRPGQWIATLIGKDPEELLIVVSNEEDVNYAARYVEAMRMAGKQETAPISLRVIESGQPLILPDISVEDFREYLNRDVREYLDRNPWMGDSKHVGAIFVPMRARGAIVGALGHVEPRSSNPLTEKDALWIQAIADRTAVAVENAQLYEDAVKRLERLGAMQSVNLAVSASPDLRLTLKVILDHVTSQLKVDAADVLLLDESDNTLALSASTGFLATSVPDYRLPAEDGLPGRTATSRRIETVTALSAFSQFRRRSLFAREGFKAYGAVPLISRGKLLGALEVFHRSPLTPDQEWLSFLDALGSVAAVAIDSATMQERLRSPRTLAGAAKPTRPPLDLSRIESDIMRLAVEGLTNREIATRIHLSPNTVKFHIRQILQKTGSSNRTELAHEAAKQGWL